MLRSRGNQWPRKSVHLAKTSTRTIQAKRRFVYQNLAFIVTTKWSWPIATFRLPAWCLANAGLNRPSFSLQTEISHHQRDSRCKDILPAGWRELLRVKEGGRVPRRVWIAKSNGTKQCHNTGTLSWLAYLVLALLWQPTHVPAAKTEGSLQSDWIGCRTINGIEIAMGCPSFVRVYRYDWRGW